GRWTIPPPRRWIMSIAYCSAAVSLVRPSPTAPKSRTSRVAPPNAPPCPAARLTAAVPPTRTDARRNPRLDTAPRSRLSEGDRSHMRKFRDVRVAEETRPAGRTAGSAETTHVVLRAFGRGTPGPDNRREGVSTRVAGDADPR